jgi:hypothetical protein
VSEPETETEEEWVIEYQASPSDRWKPWALDYCHFTLEDAREALRRWEAVYRLVYAWRIVHETTVYTVTREVVR